MNSLTPEMFKKRPDQTAYQINRIIDQLDDMKNTIRISSKDKKYVIIIGEQPINPSTGRPYSFGIHQYRVLGDRLEEV